MKRIKRGLALTTLAVTLAVPAIASANWNTTRAERQYSVQVHNKASLSGLRVAVVSFNCRSDGGGQYSCYAQDVFAGGGRHFKYGIFVVVMPNGSWHTTGSATLLAAW